MLACEGKQVGVVHAPAAAELREQLVWTRACTRCGEGQCRVSTSERGLRASGARRWPRGGASGAVVLFLSFWQSRSRLYRVLACEGKQVGVVHAPAAAELREQLVWTRACTRCGEGQCRVSTSERGLRASGARRWPRGGASGAVVLFLSFWQSRSRLYRVLACEGKQVGVVHAPAAAELREQLVWTRACTRCGEGQCRVSTSERGLRASGARRWPTAWRASQPCRKGEQKKKLSSRRSRPRACPACGAHRRHARCPTWTS